MVFYFTGTGNSLYAAKQLDTELISIPQIIRGDELAFSADSIGIVCPIYGHEIPSMVKQFIQRSVFETNAVLIHVRFSGDLLVERMCLYLIDHRSDASEGSDVDHSVGIEVGNPDGTNFAFLIQIF